MLEQFSYTNIILPVPLRQTFTYKIPSELQHNIHTGCRVIVQFGKQKLYTGLVLSIHNSKPEYETKGIEMVLDESPIINETQLQFWNWIANYYMCSLGEVLKAALPSGLKLESQSRINLNEEWIEEEKLTEMEEVVYQFLYQNPSATIQQINKLTRRSNAYPVLKSLLNKGAIQINEVVAERYRPKTISHISIAEHLKTEVNMELAFESLKNSKKQLELLMWILNEIHFYSSQPLKSLDKKVIQNNTSFSPGVLNGLIKKGYLKQEELEVDRLETTEKSASIKALNANQLEALNKIHAEFKSKSTVLLHGVTASGKTEIYIQLIQEQLKAGKQVLYLLPEIALTSQIIDRLTSVFGTKAGVYHSKFNDQERVEIWNKVLEFNNSPDNKYQLILGTRSSLFLPFTNLGLIIVDEEHETSFKQQDPAPRYHARDAAIVLAGLFNAKVLLGTATPSFESYFNTRLDKYGLVNLTSRHHNVTMPEIVVSDLNEAYKRKQMKSYFGPELFSEMESTLQKKEQIILFQNRRGFSSFIQCNNCGWIPKCKNCDVSLTYHKFQNNLLCHYCGYSTQLAHKCGNCESTDVKTKGFGTQKIEDELQLFFPDVKIGRLDIDSTKTKSAFNKIIQKFTEGKTQILVGTQMITKGLDFENVNLVGILNADNLLNFPDFRAYERAYQLMAQVSGRAGRKNKRGKVIIQTSQPDNPVIQLVKENNFEQMFDRFIGERKVFNYPPWFRLIYITVKHKNRDRAMLAANQLGQELRKNLDQKILGPEFHLISKMQQYYQLMLRIKLDKKKLYNETKDSILDCIEKVKHLENNTSVIFTIDADPM